MHFLRQQKPCNNNKNINNNIATKSIQNPQQKKTQNLSGQKQNIGRTEKKY